MEDHQDILLKICSKLDDQSLEKLSHTILWRTIRLFLREEYFWFLRTQHLINRELKPSSSSWKTAYHLLVSALQQENPFSEGEYVEDYHPAHHEEEFIQNELSLKIFSNELVTSILLDLGYDPSVSDNWPIRCSSENGYIEVVRLLLKDERVDPTAGYDYAIQLASKNGHSEVMELLLSDVRVDSSWKDNDITSYYL